MMMTTTTTNNLFIRGGFSTTFVSKKYLCCCCCYCCEYLAIHTSSKPPSCHHRLSLKSRKEKVSWKIITKRVVCRRRKKKSRYSVFYIYEWMGVTGRPVAWSTSTWSTSSNSFACSHTFSCLRFWLSEQAARSGQPTPPILSSSVNDDILWCVIAIAYVVLESDEKGRKYHTQNTIIQPYLSSLLLLLEHTGITWPEHKTFRSSHHGWSSS